MTQDYYHPGFEEIPPPPAGFKNKLFLIGVYIVLGFMMLWTGACTAVVIDDFNERDGSGMVVAMFMVAGSVIIVLALIGWILRIHNRRAAYQRILDDHYAQRYGHHPEHY